MSFLTGILYLDTIILTSVLTFLIYKYFTRSFNYWANRGVVSIKPIPFFGNFKDVMFMKQSIGHFLANLYNRTKGDDFFGIYVFNTPHLIIRSPELVKNILVKDFQKFHNRTVCCDEKADPIVSKVLFFMHNPEWKSMRNKLSPLFTSGKLRNMLSLIINASDEFTEHLHKVGKNEGSVEIKEIVAKFATNVITACAFGVDAECFKHEKAEFREVGRKMFDFTINNSIRTTSYFFAPSLVKFLKLTFFNPEVNEFCRKTFWETINEREKSGVKRNDLVDLIIDLKKTGNFDDYKFEGDTVVAQALQFFAAGFETTSSTISFALYEMCMNQDIQTKLRQEINSQLEISGEITYDAINSMKYLDKILKETLRKYPILPFLDRCCNSDYPVPGSKYVIEKGTPVYIPVLGLHHDPEYFPEPDVFDPERFSEENIKTRPSASYIPFGTGPHNCIGERFGLITSKLGVIQVIKNFVLEPTKETPVPIVFDPKGFTLQSTVGIPLKLSPCKQRVSGAA